VTDESSADFEYYNWVDQFNTLGLGENIPIVTGTSSIRCRRLTPPRKNDHHARPVSDGLLLQRNGRRIDNAKRRLEGTRRLGHLRRDMTWHIEGGAGTKIKF